MGLIAYLAAKFGTKTPAPAPKRSTGFAAADYSRLTASMASSSTHITAILRAQGRTLRARSRQVIDNNPYGAKFASMAVSNICGPQPFRLQAKIKSSRGKLDTFSNSRVETEWGAWGEPGNCDITGTLSWADIQRLIVRTLVSDGECLLRVLEGPDFGPWGVQLQIIDTDRLDEEKNQDMGNRGAIVTGIELDGYGRRVAYHILKSPPRQWQYGMITREYYRIPAEQIIHLYLSHRPEQLRGIPWLYASLLNLHQLGAFEEAAVIAARVGASKMGFFEKTDPAAEYISETDSTGAKITDAEPGTFEYLDAGLSFKEWNPQFPNEAVGPFIKSCLRGVASGVGVSYHSLASDLESVNFSSARAGLLEERDNWMMLQDWLIEHLHNPLYKRRWLEMASLTGRLPIQGPITKYHDVIWLPKRWQWVDPMKDVQSNIEAIKWGLKSRTQCIAETGGDFEDIVDQLAAENDLAENKDVEIEEQKAAASAPRKKPQGGNDDDTADDKKQQ